MHAWILISSCRSPSSLSPIITMFQILVQFTSALRNAVSSLRVACNDPHRYQWTRGWGKCLEQHVLRAARSSSSSRSTASSRGRRSSAGSGSRRNRGGADGRRANCSSTDDSLPGSNWNTRRPTAVSRAHRWSSGFLS